MTIASLEEVNAALEPFVAKNGRLTDTDLKLERTFKLLEKLGNPHESLRIVHIAGTSGKTSTSYYMTALLKAAGKKVGLTVSPHVDGINERVQVDGKPLPEKIFCDELGEFLDLVRGVVDSPSYFELMTAFAFWVFARHGVDYAVLETGLGGMYDATNVAGRRDKLCIITDIGFDHMNVLGNTLAKISAQKAGIIHENNHVFMYKQSGEIMRSVHRRTSKYHATLHLLDEPAERKIWQKDLTNIAPYQQRNWLLAYGAYRYLEQRDGLKNLESDELRHTQFVRVPGRMDVRPVKGKTIIMDGAHNTQKMTAWINSFKHLYPGEKPAMLISLRDTKEYKDLVPMLVPLAGRVIVTAFETSQDAQVRSMEPEELAEAFRQAGLKNAQAIPDRKEAFQAMLDAPEQMCVITGSFYLLNQIRNNELSE